MPDGTIKETKISDVKAPHPRNRHARRRITWVSGVLVIIFMSVLLFFVFGRDSTVKSISAQTVQSPQEQEQKQVVLAAPGRVEGAGNTIEVSASANGVIRHMLVDEGQRVTAGQNLALLSCHDVEGEIAAGRAAVESSQQARTRLMRGSRNEERARAAAETSAARSNLNQVRSQYDRTTHLVEDGVVSREEWERTRRDLEVAESNLRSAQERERLINAPPLPEEIARANADIVIAQERVNQATARLNECTVKAPISGIVLRVHLRAGEAVSSAFPRPIVSVTDMSKLRVRAEVDERDIGRVSLAQHVRVIVDAYPGHFFNGRVTTIGNIMGRRHILTGDPAEKSDRDVLEVLVDLDAHDTLMVVGLRVTVQFIRV
jgi:HlyD family secretion protein